MSTLNDLIAASMNTPTIVVESEVLAEAASELKADRRKSAVNACKGLLEQFTSTLQRNVATLRQMREAEKKQATLVKDTDKALRFFGKTGNPLPFFKLTGNIGTASMWCSRCGIDVPDAKSEAWKIPEDFE